MSRARLVIICGLPGSGKSTTSRQVSADLDAVHLDADEWMVRLGVNLWDETARARVEALQWDIGRELLRAGRCVVVEWGTWSRQERDRLRRDARRLGAEVELIALDPPLDVLMDRLRSRGAENPPITRQQMEGWATQFERPTPAELHLYDRVITEP